MHGDTMTCNSCEINLGLEYHYRSFVVRFLSEQLKCSMHHHQILGLQFLVSGGHYCSCTHRNLYRFHSEKVHVTEISCIFVAVLKKNFPLIHVSSHNIFE